ncbi:hypothetical protein C8F01DRAFT_1264818 [Mycena amicta]|nr:hypothetical protein C8F01DRAFT_1264818 [Mycena amicta]
MSSAASSSNQDLLPEEAGLGAGAKPSEEGSASASEEQQNSDEETEDEEAADKAAGRAAKLKGWARGVREDQILKKHIEPYRRARQMGSRDAEDYLQMVCNEYCYRIPYDLADSEEPPLPLREWTPTTPPDDDSHLSKKEKKEKAAWIVWMMPRIKRWLDYRAQGGTHATAATGKKLDPTDPINIMLFQIADTLPAHRARQGWQQFWHEEAQTTVEAEVVRRWPISDERTAALAKRKEKEAKSKGKGKGKEKPDVKPTGAFRQAMARELFGKMSKQEQKRYLERAAAEKAVEAGAFEAAMKAWPPKEPEAIQAAIDNLEKTVGRIMQGIAELTNMHVVMVLGGPSPRFHGSLHTVHFSAGENNAPSPVAFPDWDARHFETHTLGKMKTYLRTAYSPEECMAAALPEHIYDAPWNAIYTANHELGRPQPHQDSEESEGETGGKRKRKASSSSGRGEKGKKSKRGGGPEARTRKRKAAAETAETGENGSKKRGRLASQKSKKAQPAERTGIITGLPRPLPRAAYSKPAALVARHTASTSTTPTSTTPTSTTPTSTTPTSTTPSEDHPDDERRPLNEELPDDERPPLDEEENEQQNGDGVGHEEEEDEDGSVEVICPEDASQWLREIWPEIAGQGVTQSYNDLLAAFVAFERAQGWSDGDKALSASARPKQVKAWIRADRKATPQTTKLHKRYEEEFWTWWKFIQPAWRKAKTEWAAKDALQVNEQAGDSWAVLSVPGKNGLVSVIASLYWWGRDGVVGEGVSEAWRNAVKDVTWALRRMTSA